MKNKVLLIIIGIVLLFPVVVKAENKLYFEKDEITIAPGKTYELNMLVDSDSDFSKLSFNVITTSNLINFASVSIDENFTRSASSSGYILEAKTKLKSGSNVAKVVLKVSDSAPVGTTGNIRIVNASLTSDNTYQLPITQVKVTVGEDVKSNFLSSLTSSLAEIKFDKNTLTYEVEVDSSVEEFDLEAIAEDSLAKVTISDQMLDNEKNTITVKVSREGLNDKVYKVIVNKKVDEEDIAQISDDEEDVKESSPKIKWIPILGLLFVVLSVDLLFIKKRM